MLFVGGDVKAPALITKVEPKFPGSNQEYELGLLIVEAIVARDGRLREVRILKGPSNSFAAAAIDSIRQWRYRPATLHDEPVEVSIVITVNDFPMTPR